jgi:hypothetical protein
VYECSSEIACPGNVADCTLYNCQKYATSKVKGFITVSVNVTVAINVFMKILKPLYTYTSHGSADSLVSITIGYGLESRDSIPDRDKRFFSTAQCPDRLWGPP